MDNPTVQIGLHDGRLIQENSIEIDENIVLKLQEFAEKNALNYASQMYVLDDAMFNYSECQELEKELIYIITYAEENAVKIASEKILVLTRVCIQIKNRRIKLYVAGN
jgi:hypothetical protein